MSMLPADLVPQEAPFEGLGESLAHDTIPCPPPSHPVDFDIEGFLQEDD